MGPVVIRSEDTVLLGGVREAESTGDEQREEEDEAASVCWKLQLAVGTCHHDNEACLLNIQPHLEVSERLTLDSTWDLEEVFASDMAKSIIAHISMEIHL